MLKAETTNTTLAAPIVFIRDGEVFASSLAVARNFEKPHRHVLRDIDSLLKTDESLMAEGVCPDLGIPPLTRDFIASHYVEEQNGQRYRCFDMTREGFTTLIMGFTGAKAHVWKRRYSAAFNAMEAELRGHAAPAPARTERTDAPRERARSVETVTSLYAEIAKCKANWSAGRIDDGGPLLAKGARLAKDFAAAPAASLAEVSMKFTEALEWVTDDISDAAKALLLFGIIDLDRLTAERPAGPGRWPAKQPRAEPVPPSEKARVDRRSRPITIGGQKFQSIAAAARATGRNYTELRNA